MPLGGARPGAGRKPKPKRAVKKVLAEAILSSVNELEMWTDLLTATVTTENATFPDYNIRFKALQYLTNRRDGMPAQSVILTEESELEFGNIPAPSLEPRAVN